MPYPWTPWGIGPHQVQSSPSASRISPIPVQKFLGQDQDWTGLDGSGLDWSIAGLVESLVVDL